MSTEISVDVKEPQVRRQRSQAPNLEDIPFDQVLKGNVGYPLSTFPEFLRAHHALESLLFYQEVEKYKLSKTEETRKGIEEGLLENFIAPGAVSEINIPGDMREEVLRKLSDETVVDMEAFDQPQAEVVRLLVSDKYPSFLQVLREKNLNPKLCADAFSLGLKLFLFGIVLATAFVALQAVTNNGNSNIPEIFNNRYWRMIAFPFIYMGLDFVLISKTGVCPLCADLGSYHGADGENDISYGKLFLQGVAQRIGLQKVDDFHRIEIPEIERILSNTGRWYTVLASLLAMTLQMLIVLLPPDVPRIF